MEILHVHMVMVHMISLANESKKLLDGIIDKSKG